MSATEERLQELWGQVHPFNSDIDFLLDVVRDKTFELTKLQQKFDTVLANSVAREASKTDVMILHLPKPEQQPGLCPTCYVEVPCPTWKAVTSGQNL